MRTSAVVSTLLGLLSAQVLYAQYVGHLDQDLRLYERDIYDINDLYDRDLDAMEDLLLEQRGERVLELLARAIYTRDDLATARRKFDTVDQQVHSTKDAWRAADAAQAQKKAQYDQAKAAYDKEALGKSQARQSQREKLKKAMDNAEEQYKSDQSLVTRAKTQYKSAVKNGKKAAQDYKTALTLAHLAIPQEVSDLIMGALGKDDPDA